MSTTGLVDPFDLTSPADNRYYEPKVAQYLSPNGLTRGMLLVERYHAEQLHKLGLCPADALTQIKRACTKVTATEVSELERQINHDIRALVGAFKRYVDEASGEYVHAALTSMDVKITAEIYNYKQLWKHVILPKMMQLERILIRITRSEARIVQAGRTHLQHGVPITLGFAFGEYVDRWGDCILHMRQYVDELRGKIRGATGSANALTLLLGDKARVLEYEAAVLRKLSLRPSRHSTQLPAVEPRVRLMGEVTTAAGVLYKIANDMRLMCMTEISEIEAGSIRSGGSSAMGQKVNPQDFEQVCSFFRRIIGTLVTVHLNQMSDFQRDLMDSASTRTYAETISYFYTAVRVMCEAMDKIAFNYGQMETNLNLTRGGILTEAYKTLLVKYACTTADALMREIAAEARRTERSVPDVAFRNSTIFTYVKKMNPEEIDSLSNYGDYVGIAPELAASTADYWEQKLRIGF